MQCLVRKVARMRVQSRFGRYAQPTCLQLFVVGTMYCDLFVPTPPPLLLQPTKNAAGNQQKKGKGKQAQQQQLVSRVGTEGTAQTMFTIAQLNALEKRIDMLIHCMLSDLR